MTKQPRVRYSVEVSFYTVQEEWDEALGEYVEVNSKLTGNSVITSTIDAGKAEAHADALVDVDDRWDTTQTCEHDDDVQDCPICTPPDPEAA